MESLKRFLLTCLVSISVSSPALADVVPQSILKWIKSFQVHSVNLSSGVLQVIVSKPNVSSEMYRAIAIDGVCTALFAESGGWGEAKIDRIEVLNNAAAQGYGLLDAKANCRRIGDLSGAEVKKFLPTQTVNCIAGSCKR